MLERHRSLWQGLKAHCYADSGSSAGVYLNVIAAEGWHDTVSDNIWTDPLERTAQVLPALAWTQNGDARHESSSAETPGPMPGVAERCLASRQNPKQRCPEADNGVGCPPRTQPVAGFDLPARPFARSNRQVHSHRNDWA